MTKGIKTRSKITLTRIISEDYLEILRTVEAQLASDELVEDNFLDALLGDLGDMDDLLTSNEVEEVKFLGDHLTFLSNLFTSVKTIQSGANS